MKRVTGRKEEFDADARVWLRRWGYDDIVDAIDAMMRKWYAEGNGTRRNWWDVLAGTREGKPCTINGVTFPVLRAARRRKGWPEDVPGAVQRSALELAPPVREQERWREARR